VEAAAKAPTPAGMIKADGVRPTRIILTSIALGAVILLSIFEVIWIILLHQDHLVVHLRSYRGLTDALFSETGDVPWEEEGWPTRNTRLRYAWSAIGILVVLINFIPWRSRVIAYIFAFIYFVLGAMAMVSFAVDVHELREARDRDCPLVPYQNLRNQLLATELATTPLSTDPTDEYSLIRMNSELNCISSPYVAIAVIEFIVTVAIIIYLLNEYILRWSSVHSQRKYPWFQVRKIENELDSRRPVRCELTSEVMTAKEYYYKHRFLAGPATVGSPLPNEYVDAYVDPALMGGMVGSFSRPPLIA
jgi:hypothetical protein